MEMAIEKARTASFPDVPVGALLVDSRGRVVSMTTNRRERDSDPSGHAEILALREASRDQGTWRLENHTLYVTLEPCLMCAGAIAEARVSGVVFGAWDERLGAAGSVYDILRDPRVTSKIEVIGGVLANECSLLLRDFFSNQRT